MAKTRHSAFPGPPLSLHARFPGPTSISSMEIHVTCKEKQQGSPREDPVLRYRGPVLCCLFTVSPGISHPHIQGPVALVEAIIIPLRTDHESRWSPVPADWLPCMAIFALYLYFQGCQFGISSYYTC